MRTFTVSSIILILALSIAGPVHATRQVRVYEANVSSQTDAAAQAHAACAAGHGAGGGPMNIAKLLRDALIGAVAARTWPPLRDADRSFAAFVPLGLVMSPLLWSQHLALVLIPAVVVMALLITRLSMQTTGGPPFFDQNQFLVSAPLSLLLFVGLTVWAIVEPSVLA